MADAKITHFEQRWTNKEKPFFKEFQFFFSFCNGKSSRITPVASIVISCEQVKMFHAGKIVRIKCDRVNADVEWQNFLWNPLLFSALIICRSSRSFEVCRKRAISIVIAKVFFSQPIQSSRKKMSYRNPSRKFWVNSWLLLALKTLNSIPSSSSDTKRLPFYHRHNANPWPCMAQLAGKICIVRHVTFTPFPPPFPL